MPERVNDHPGAAVGLLGDRSFQLGAAVSRPPRYDIGRQEVLSIPSRIDGAAIQIGVVRPEVPTGTRVR